ncbi:MAG: DUF3095 family protein [Saprospiraceae bacterium]
MDNRFFYKRLMKFDVSLQKLIGDETLFQAVPEDWYIIVADVKKSTQAVRDGHHHEVNLAATGAIIAVLNEIKSQDKELNTPYFFGGDGVTFIVPKFVLNKVMLVLENYSQHVKKNMHLVLRVGSMEIKQVYKDNQKVNIAKIIVNESLTLPIVLGNGLKHAEKIVKATFVNEAIDSAEILPINLDGMECRWQEIDTPKEEEKIVCLLVHCPDEDRQSEVYASVISTINKTFGNYKMRHPITTKKLKLDLSIKKMRNEMYARLGERNIFYFIKNWLTTIIGKFYFIYFKEGQEYLKKVRQLSYTFMVDGTFNTVIAGTPNEVEELIKTLDQLETENKIIYGIHITHASIMSCYVQDRKSKHIHFIDGTEGGYTTAAKMYKAKLAKF